MLQEHLDLFAELRQAVGQRDPDAVETMALGGMLHGFYNGVENLLKRVALHCDGGLPRGPAWHQRLLDSMGQPSAGRPAVLSGPLLEELGTYLDFRHFFRQAYAFHVRWVKMAPLVSRCEEALKRLAAELSAYLSASGAG